MSEPRRSDWTSPGTILGIIGMILATAGWWAFFESRVTAVEKDTSFNTRILSETREDMKEVNAKLDRLIERRGG